MKEILCHALSGNNELVTIYKENNKLYRTINVTHIGQVEEVELKELPNDTFGKEAQKNLLEREKYKRENLLEGFKELPALECNERNSIYGEGITLKAMGVKEDSVEHTLLKNMVKKMYVYDGYMQYPHIAEKLLRFILGKVTYFGKVVTSPNQLELEKNEVKNIKDNAIDLDFIQYVSKGVGLKELTMLGLIDSYKRKENPKKFKAKARKRGR